MRKEAALFLYALLLSGGIYLCLRRPSEEFPVFLFWSLMGGANTILLALHLSLGFRAFDLLFGRRRSLINKIWLGLWFAMIALALASTVPAVASFSVPLLYLVHSVTFLRSRLWSIENILFQNFLFHWAVASVAAQPWVEAVAGARIAGSALIALLVSTALVMHSGGWEKWKSPLWREGAAVGRFLNQRHILTGLGRMLSGLGRVPETLRKCSGWVVLIAEFALLPAMLHPWALLAVIVILFAFSVSLFVIVDISYIGQSLAILLAGFGWLLLSGDYGGFAFPARFHWEDAIFLVGFLATCVVVHFPGLSNRLGIGWVQHFFSGVSSPIMVFTQRHLEGNWLYRFEARGEGGCAMRLPQVFTEQGHPGALQRWRPRYLQSVMYLLGRRLPELQAGEGPSDANEVVEDLAACILKGSPSRATEVSMLVTPAAEAGAENSSWVIAWSTVAGAKS